MQRNGWGGNNQRRCSPVQNERGPREGRKKRTGPLKDEEVGKATDSIIAPGGAGAGLDKITQVTQAALLLPGGKTCM